ncbi:sensor histidine kinase [Streptomyces kanamyceticus]|uniref:histidine kinase n=1 Tax=Streptomyces kanamyceticus TaxID=1967 RepID=A0A5J6GMI1_STRKN|nr:histidine kinase [Streptomyces kanamyceticus]QEU97150.1 sensor histidine kinase [Streptomyces kanamyceticus]
MPALSPLSLLKRPSVGAWAAVAWCVGLANALRSQFGIPGMPTGDAPLGAGDWVLVAASVGLVCGAARLLGPRPLTALGLFVAATFTATLASGETGITFLHYLAIDVAMARIVAGGSRRARWTALGVSLCVLPGYALTRQWSGLPVQLPHTIDTSWTGWQTYSLLAAVGWLVGKSVRQSREYARRMSAQAAAQAVTAERLRIAREMHDTVAHSIGIIALQAGAAARVVETQPARAREAMVAVETAGRETLSGLRRMLGALRQADTASDAASDPASGPAPVPAANPAAGLADLDRIAAATTAAGVRVEVVRRGEQRPLPSDVDLSAFRIIQESITNVVRHSGARSCRVSVDHRAGELIIEVADSGRGHVTNPASGGFGLAGMRERAALLHGEFSAGPRPGGGFLVTARLPVPAPARAAVAG